MTCKRTIAVITPRLPKVGGAEICIWDFINNNRDRYNIEIFEVIPRPLRVIGIFQSFLRAILHLLKAKSRDAHLFLFWNTVPLMLLPVRGHKIFFVNSLATPGWYRRLGQDMAVWLADSVVADSDIVRDSLWQQYPRDRDKIVSIPFIPTVNYQLRSDNKRSKDLIRLVYVGRWSPEKGTAKMLALLEAIEKHENNFLLTIITDQMKPELEKVQSSTKVHVLIQPSRNKIFEELSASHFFVLFSDYEGLSLATYEAMLCGTPPLSFGQGHFNSLFCLQAPELKFNMETFDPQDILGCSRQIVMTGKFDHYSQICRDLSSGYEAFSVAFPAYLDQKAAS